MRELLWIGLLTLIFGLASIRLQGILGPFAIAQISLGARRIAGAACLALKRIGRRRRGLAAFGLLRDPILTL